MLHKELLFNSSKSDTQFRVIRGSYPNCTSMRIDPEVASPGATVTVTIFPNEGYVVKSVSTDPFVNVTNNYGNTYTFTMPESNITFSCITEQKSFGITVKASNGITHSIPSSAPVGQRIYMELGNIPAVGKTPIIKINGQPYGGLYSFVMPAQETIVELSLGNITTYRIRVYDDAAVNSYISVSGDKGTSGDVRAYIDMKTGEHFKYTTHSEANIRSKVGFVSIGDGWYKPKYEWQGCSITFDWFG